MYGSWDMKCNRQNFLSFWTIFCLFTPLPPPPNNPKNENFEKLKKRPGGIIILQTCTINDNHMMYSSWDMKYDRHNFCHFGQFFCLFITLTTQKIKILKKMKQKSADIIILHVYHKWQSHDVLFLRYEAWWTEFFVILDCFLPFYLR